MCCVLQIIKPWVKVDLNFCYTPSWGNEECLLEDLIRLANLEWGKKEDPKILCVTLKTLPADRELPMREWNNLINSNEGLKLLERKTTPAPLLLPMKYRKKSSIYLLTLYCQLRCLRSTSIPYSLRRQREQKRLQQTGRCKSELQKGIMFPFCDLEDNKEVMNCI